MLITFGLDVVITYLAQLAFSADFRTINPGYAGSNITIGGIVIPLVRLAAFVIAFALAAALWWLLELDSAWSRNSRHAQNLVAARLYGITPTILYPVTFGIGAALAGAAGGLYGMVGATHTLHRR